MTIEKSCCQYEREHILLKFQIKKISLKMAEGENEFEYFMYGPVLVPIAALGIIGNILSIIVYSRSSMRKSAINIILIGLFICIL